MIVNIFPPQRSLKNLIMNILLVNEKNSVEDIRKKIKKEYNVSSTYQGINKILNFLKEEKIAKKKDNLWSIDKEWTKTTSKTLDRYVNKEDVPIFTPEIKTISFQNIGKAFEFITTNLESGTLFNEGDNTYITHVKNIAMLSLDKKSTNFFKNFMKNGNWHVIVENNNFLNRLLGKYLKSFGCNVYIGIKRSTPYTITVCGNTLFHTYSSFNISGYMNSLYNKIKKITSPEAMKLFNSMRDDNRFSIKFTFETDKEIVEQTREYLLNIAKGKRL